MTTLNGTEPIKAHEPEQDLQSEVIRMREELRGLRAGAALRAVIEVAKGIIAEREGIDPEKAFLRLRATSQQHNVRLTEVAATVVGVAQSSAESDLPVQPLPRDDRPACTSAMSSQWRSLREEPRVRAGVEGALMDCMAGATTSGDAAAELIRSLWPPARAPDLVLYRRLGDGGLALVGQAGVPRDVTQSWRTIPPIATVPPILAVQQDRSFYWTDEKERLAAFPLAVARRSAYEGAAMLPIHECGHVVGLLSLMWNASRQFSEQRRRRYERIADELGATLLRNVSGARMDEQWLAALLRVQFDPWILLRHSGGPGSSLHTLTVAAVSPDLPQGLEWVEHHVLELWPDLAREESVVSLLAGSGTNATGTTTVSRSVAAPWGHVGTVASALHLQHHTVIMWHRPPGPT